MRQHLKSTAAGAAGALLVVALMAATDPMIVRSDGLEFPDGTVQTTAATSSSTSGSEWVCPFWQDGATAGSQWASFAVVNNGSSAVTVTGTFFDANGNSIATVSMPDLAVGEQWQFSTGSLGGPSATEGTEGYLKITSSSGEVGTLTPWGAEVISGDSSFAVSDLPFYLY